MYSDEYVVTGVDYCVEFDSDLWSDLGKIIWRKHHYIFQYHVKNMHNDIVKPFRLGILQYTERVCEIHDLDNFPPTSSKEGGWYDMADWAIHGKELSEDGIHVATK